MWVISSSPPSRPGIPSEPDCLCLERRRAPDRTNNQAGSTVPHSSARYDLKTYSRFEYCPQRRSYPVHHEVGTGQGPHGKDPRCRPAREFVWEGLLAPVHVQGPAWHSTSSAVRGGSGAPCREIVRRDR